MKRLLWVARQAYIRQARRKGFLLAAFGLPLLMLVGFAVLFVVILMSERTERAIGYVDNANILANVQLPAQNADDEPYVPLLPFPDADAARAAFAQQQIDAYVVLAPDYPTTGRATVYGSQGLSNAGRNTLRDALERGLLAQSARDPTIAERALNPVDELIRRSLDGQRETSTASAVAAVVLPILFGLLFLVTVFSSASYLLQALVEEKENRTMEIVTTSISPWQLVGGKVLGLGLLGLTLALIWLVAGGVVWGIGVLQFAALREITWPLNVLGVALLFFVPGYLVYAGLMVAISAAVTSAQEGQQFAGVITLLATAPLITSALFLLNPNGVIPVTLSFFPLSAPLAMLMRMAATEVPLWQIGLSLALLLASDALVLWGAARLFRAGMLRYGKRLSMRDLLRALRPASSRTAIER